MHTPRPRVGALLKTHAFGELCSWCGCAYACAVLQMRVSKWVDRLQKQFYGTSFAYDKAIRAEVGQGITWGRQG